MSTETDRLVRERAYHLWEADGRKPGRSEEYWARAEIEVGATAPVSAAKTKSATPKAVSGKAPASVEKAAAAKPAAKPAPTKSAKAAADGDAAKRRSPPKFSPAPKT